MWGVEIGEQPVDMEATADAIYATATEKAAQTATAIAPYITPTATPTRMMLP